jgi:DNA sulfur modification protein DndD
MILTKLTLRNFKRFKDNTEFNLEIISSKKNIVLIEALNWVWKTSFLQAVQWAFFWLENSDFKRYLNYEARDEWDLAMEIILEYKDNDFKVCSIKRKYSSFSFDWTYKEAIEFSVNWERKLLNSEEWNDYLNKTFPKEISNFFFFDWEKIQYLLNPNDPKKVKSAMEKVLWIEVIRNLKEDLIDLKSESFKKMNNDSLDKKIQIKQAQLNDFESKKSKLKIELNNLELQLSNDEERKRSVLSNIEILAKSGLTREKIDEKNYLLKILENYNREITLISEDINNFKNNYLDTFLLIELFDEVKDRIKREDQIKNGASASNIGDDAINRIIQELYMPVCLVWWEKFDSTKKDFIKRKIESALFWGINSNNEALVLDLNNKEEVELNLAFNNALKWEELNLNEIIDRKNYLQDQIDLVKKSIQDIDRQTLWSEEPLYNIDTLYWELANLDSSLQALLIDISIKTKDLVFIENEIRKIQRELETYLSQIPSLNADKKYFDLVSKLIVVFETYIEQLVSRRKKELEEKTFEMFSILINSNVYSWIEITENYEIKLIDKGWNYQEALNSWHLQILMTSLLWGLEQLSKLGLPIIIDTPLARLDPIHRKNMLEKYFTNAWWQVIILSQPSEITEQDKNNILFTDHLRNDEYIKMEFDEEEMQSFLRYESLSN